MNFDYREYLKKEFLRAVGKMDDYKIILNSAGYLDKGILFKSDLEEIQNAIDAKNAAIFSSSLSTTTPEIPAQTDDTSECINEEVLVDQ